jgi:hypothetical protein
MPRPKGSKLTQEHKDLLRKKALEYHEKIRELKENVGKNVESNNKNDAGENGITESNVSESENDNRESRGGDPETLEIEKGEVAKMEIPPKKPLEITEPESTPESFTCANCQGNLTMGTKFCPHCGCQLDWSVAS